MPQGDLSYKEGAPRALSFCQWMLAEDTPAMLVVEDARKDRRCVLRCAALCMP